MWQATYVHLLYFCWMTRKIKFGIVGYGRIGKRHAKIIQQHPEAELLAVCDLKSIQELPYSVAIYDSLEALLTKELSIEVVCICTPNGLHAQQAIQVLSHKKHVLIEKPMALTKADAEAIIFKALQVSKAVFCVMQNRYSPPAIWLKQLIHQGKLGEIYLLQINCYWNRDDRYYRPNGVPHDWHGTRDLDGGTLFTQFSHFIDLLYWVFGDIKDIKTNLKNLAHPSTIAFEDSGTVIFELVNGGMGALSYSTAIWDRNMESSITVIGAKGSLKIGGQYMDKVVYCHIQDYVMPTLPASNPANDYGTYKGSANNHGFVFENVIDVLKGKKEISTNALEGMKVVEMIERIYAENGRT